MESTDHDAPSPDRAPYETPLVVDYGSLAELTAGNADGNFLDRSFPVGTPKRDLTFS